MIIKYAFLLGLGLLSLGMSIILSSSAQFFVSQGVKRNDINLRFLEKSGKCCILRPCISIKWFSKLFKMAVLDQ